MCPFITIIFFSILYIHICIHQYIEDTYSSLYAFSLPFQQWKDDSVDSVALMCQGVSRTDSSHMYSLIVMYPQLPCSCPMVQMRETRQAIWEKLWHKSSSNNWLKDMWRGIHAATVFCLLLCLPLALSHLVCMYSMYVLWQWCLAPHSAASITLHYNCSTKWGAHSHQEACGTHGKQEAAIWTLTSSSSGYAADSNPLSELLQKTTYYNTRGVMTINSWRTILALYAHCLTYIWATL